MNKNPLISVIMSVYNEEVDWVEKSIQSILKQTYQNFEFIIILDDPNNKILIQLIKDYPLKNPKIKFLINKINIGLANSLNKGLKIALGEFIARMDADDIAINTRFEKQLSYFNEHADVDLISTKMIFINDNGDILEQNNDIIIDENVAFKLINYSNLYNHPTWMFKKKVLNKLISYRDFPCSQDYDFILRLIDNGFKIVNIDEVLLKYRLRNNSIGISKNALQQKLSLYAQKLHKQRLKYGYDKFDKNYINDLINSDEVKKLSKSIEYKKKSKIELYKKNYIICGYFIIRSIFESKSQIIILYNNLMKRIIRKTSKFK